MYSVEDFTIYRHVNVAAAVCIIRLGYIFSLTNGSIFNLIFGYTILSTWAPLSSGVLLIRKFKWLGFFTK